MKLQFIILKNHSGKIVHDVSGIGTAADLFISSPNTTAWSPNGLRVFSPSKVQSSLNPSKILDSCVATNELTIEAWIVPTDTIQDNAHIITLTASVNHRRFSLIQSKSSYTAKVRITPSTDLFGEPGTSTNNSVVKLNLTQVVYTRASNGKTKMYINGSEVASDSLPGSFSDWKGGSDYVLGLAGAFAGENNWLGTYYYADIYNRALSSAEVNHNYSLGMDVDTSPFISKQPKNAYVIEGETASFSVIAVSSTLLSYQWQKDGINIPGATNSTYTTNNLNLADNNLNSYRVIVTNINGSDTSNAVKVTVEPNNQRITTGIQALYDFQEGSGSTINDKSNVGAQLNLNIGNSDSVKWKPYGLNLIGSAAILTGSAATKIINSSISTNGITIEGWIKPNSSAGGWIISCSQDSATRNFLLSQQSNDNSYELRLRTSGTSTAGFPFVKTPSNITNDSLTHVVYTRDADGNVNFYINNKIKGSGNIGGDFSNWNSTYKLALGSEVNGSENWKGLFNLVAIYNRALTSTEVAQNYSLGPIGSINIAAPSNLNAQVPNASIVKLSWKDNSDNEDGFIIERQILGSIVSDFKVIDTVNSNDTSYTDLKVSDTTSYKYRIKAYNLLKESGYSNEITIETLLSIIPAPTDLMAIKDSPDTINVKLTWKDNSSNELGFVIQRKIGDSASVGTFTIIDTVAENITAYIDSTTKDTTKYTYRVYAYNVDTASAYSNLATITTPLPVELTSFSANVVNGKIIVTWETATEINNAGFSIEKSADNKKYSELAFIKGKGTSTEKSSYTYIDKSVLSGKYYYRLKQVDFDGTYQYYKSVEIDLGLPKNYSLDQNYPNPFNPSTTIRFALPANAKVNVKLYNTLGQEVANVINSELNAGVHEVIFNASNFSSGVYFYRLEARGIDGSNFVSTKRMLLLK